MTMTIPYTCTCGGMMVDDGGDYWNPPDGFRCSDCGCTDEIIAEAHWEYALNGTCDIEDCGWCEAIKQEVTDEKHAEDYWRETGIAHAQAVYEREMRAREFDSPVALGYDQMPF